MSICFNEPNDVFVPGLMVDTVLLLDCVTPEPIIPNWAAAMGMASARRKLRAVMLDLFGHFSTSNCIRVERPRSSSDYSTGTVISVATKVLSITSGRNERRHQRIECDQ